MRTNRSAILLSTLTSKLLGPKWNYRLRYFHKQGHLPNLKNPNDLSEILIRQLFDENMCLRLAKYIDKIKVRSYVNNKGLGHILLKHFGVWDSPEEISFSSLPNKFVLKCNNGCGNHVICRDKSYFNQIEAIRTLNLAIENGKNSIEPHYHYIEPKVFAEELIETSNNDLPVDYKFTCIRGEIMDVFVAVDRTTNTRYCTFDLDWNILPYTKKDYLPNEYPVKPKHLKEMAEVARTLSKDFDFVRVDLYEYRDQPYFSELTFFPWGGLLYSYTNEAIKLYGQKWRELNGA